MSNYWVIENEGVLECGPSSTLSADLARQQYKEEVKNNDSNLCGTD